MCVCLRAQTEKAYKSGICDLKHPFHPDSDQKEYKFSFPFVNRHFIYHRSYTVLELFFLRLLKIFIAYRKVKRRKKLPGDIKNNKQQGTELLSGLCRVERERAAQHKKEI